MRWIEELKKRGQALADALASLLLPEPANEAVPEPVPVRVPAKRRPSRPRR